MIQSLSPSNVIALSAIGVFLGVTIATAVTLGVAKLIRNARERRIAFLQRVVVGEAYHSVSDDDLDRFIQRSPYSFLAAYQRGVSHISLPDSRRRRFEEAFTRCRTDVLLIREIHRRSRFRRLRGSTYLAYVPSLAASAVLDIALRSEPIQAVRLRMVYAIVRQRYVQSIPTIIDSLKGSPQRYRDRVAGLLIDLGYDLIELIPSIADRQEREVQELFIAIGARFPSQELRVYLERIVERCSPPITHEAFQVLMKHYGHSMDPTAYLTHRDPALVSFAIEALGGVPSEQSIDTLIPFLGMETMRTSAIIGLSGIIESSPRFLPTVIERFREETDLVIQTGLAEVLATRAEHVCERALREDWTAGHRLLSMIVATRKASGVLAFLNRNADPSIEQRLCERIVGAVHDDPWLRDEYSVYAKDSVVRNLGLVREEIVRSRGKRHGENPARGAVAAIVLGAILVPMLIYAVSQGDASSWSFVSLFADYTIWFEEAFVVYAIALNSIYLALLIAAVLAVIDATRLWETRPQEFLFTPGILPAVSIIAPAFNEEETIVESVRALLNLRYPEYEVIVVNDGSTDNTLRRLIETFDLKRTVITVGNDLGTQPTRGLYRNRLIPGLLVVDKSNGGKADSLNTGINASRFPFYAAIDADSLLEPDALLHLAAETIDSEGNVTATGGNILPINGCRVEYGTIDQVRFPRNPLAQFQMVEYVRAFMTGRTGWARLRSLLIISGAFGLFNKQDVIDARGYLTSSERLLKDTVAEDMELVVRLTRRNYELGRPGEIRYAPGANCWTEVPETVRILTSQRDRWQRGLIDVLFFHRAISLRPRYGRAGLIAMPYHYVFELVGPWLEIQALLFLVIGLVAGILPIPIAALVFVVTIGLGSLTSLLSIQLTEWKHPIFRRFDRLFVFLYSIIENFGYRQFSSFLRLRGYISVVRQKTGWGQMRRRGFTTTKKGT